MTEDAKRFLNLKEDAQALREIEWTDCAMSPRVCTTMMHKAADLIESLSAELEQVKRERDEAWKAVDSVSGQNEIMAGALEQVKRERDAAVETMAENPRCETCKHYTPGYFCLGCKRGDKWQWRGVKEE